MLFLFRIISLIPKRLLKYDSIIKTNVAEMSSEYEFAVKKAVIDFVLGGSLKEIYKISENPTKERRGLKEAGTRYKHKYVNSFRSHSGLIVHC